MGVLSRASTAGNTCSDSIFGRTDTASALLIRAAKQAAARGGYAAPLWADPAGAQADSGVPEPDAAVAAGSEAPRTTTTTTTGCAASPQPGPGDGPLAAFAVLALLLALSRRAHRTRAGAVPELRCSGARGAEPLETCRSNLGSSRGGAPRNQGRSPSKATW
jgi:MYXO-CTERM domain-containing protein